MQLSHLSLTHFRNYSRLELPLPTGTILLYGNNAQGKTNLLEAIYYLATTKSPFAENDNQLISWEIEEDFSPIQVGRIKANIIAQSQPRQVEVRLIQEVKDTQKSFRREALVDKRKVRLMDLLGNLRVVMFLPSDVQMITGAPSMRRRYVDITLCQIDPIYCRTLSQYNKVLEQRNALLRRIAEGLAASDVLPIFSDKLAVLGSQIFVRRAKFWTAMARQAQQIYYETLTERKESIRINYLPRIEHFRTNLKNHSENTAISLGNWMIEQQDTPEQVRQKFEQELEKMQSHDINRGTTSIGPHRDDWQISINKRHLGYFGSRGQQRSAVLALKMAEIDWMTQLTGDDPLLLLDEVVAELDEHRRTALLDTVIHSTQAILTATDPAMFTENFLSSSVRIMIQNGRAEPQNGLA